MKKLCILNWIDIIRLNPKQKNISIHFMLLLSSFLFLLGCQNKQETYNNWVDRKDIKEGLIPVKNTDEKWGYINTKGNIIIPCQWSNADVFCEGMAKVMDKKGSYGFINKKGENIIPCIWYEVSNFSEGLAASRNKDGLWGVYR